MAITQADIDALDRAIAASELEVEVDGRRVRYRSIRELIDARAHLAEVVRRGGGRRSPLFYRVTPTTVRGD